jgi:DNA-directed RNA polymerase subunit beta'
MLEVNNFNAVRITLASPEQIRSWSRGEVTKPETINYRTLKPERDGLFCERIFGPTKDWECACGKYKRVRYKGIICDKCGVEVTRSKVRRERMGHIELASPVSHIWFVKGTPSRIGLLLDMTPRVLEQVLYFAKYIVTEVNEQSRQRLIAQIQQEVESKYAEDDAARQEAMSEATSDITARIEQLEEDKATQLSQVDESKTNRINDITELAQVLDAELTELRGKVTEKDLVFDPASEIIAAAGEKVGAKHEKKLREVAAAQVERIEADADIEAAQLSEPIDLEIDKVKLELAEKTAGVVGPADGEYEAMQQQAEQRVKRIEGIKPLQTLNESEYRELMELAGPKVFRAGMGAEAVRELLKVINMDELAATLRTETRSSSGQRRKKATKRLRVVEAFRKSGNHPEWMIMVTLPVLPPDLRPMVQLDGGRFATSDLNDLYRRVINRNNRLKRLLELGAPEIIIRNEKRMLQEAVDSLIDNGRRGRAVSGSSNHKLKSLSDMLKGKQGRFRQNLLGKRVDYSGRSVIVVGADLKLHQCGLPKKMALELFKPFVMRKLVESNHAHNIKSAKRIVERVRPEVWDVLEEVIHEHPVLLNRAPTLHRLGIQAFEPVLVEGSAIQIHPLVCAAFNADFDGDQMAVHVPLSSAAKREAREQMLSVNNLLLPSNGEPVVAPTLDMVLGCYYLTQIRPGATGEGKVFSDFDEARLAHDLGLVNLQAEIKVHTPDWPDGQYLQTSVGRIIFNESINTALREAGSEPYSFINEMMDKGALKRIVARLIHTYGNQATAAVLDAIKKLGFTYATRSGLTIAIGDIKIPEGKTVLLSEAEAEVTGIERQYRRGLITDEERYNEIVQVWTRVKDELTVAVGKALDPYGSVFMMAQSGAKGNIQQITQMSGMRGLMADPSGRIIELPIRSSFRDGLTVLEYFLSTHGARKGLADTAIRTADSGYLTRRLIDVAQNVIVYDTDCGSEGGIWIDDLVEANRRQSRLDNLVGRTLAADIVDEQTGEVLAERNDYIDEIVRDKIARGIVSKVFLRSPLECESRHGVCQACYGWHLGRHSIVQTGDAIGIVAAQSIGEPGTQLTMRTFHTGGVAGVDITSGLPRVEELFEARVPKGEAVLSEIDGVVEYRRDEDRRMLKVISRETYRDEHPLRSGTRAVVNEGDLVEVGQTVAETDGKPPLLARLAGVVESVDGKIVIVAEERDEREYQVPPSARMRVEDGQMVAAGDQLTEGAKDPQDILRIQGREAVQRYLVDEVQEVYRSQGVTINDKHIETIVRQMLRRLRVDTPGDTDLLPGELVDRFEYEEKNRQVLAEGGEPATAQPVLLGVTKASLNTDSFLAAASFQETTKVLTEAALAGKVDHLIGLKENVIIGKLIPAGSGLAARTEARRARLEAAEATNRLLGEPGVSLVAAELPALLGEDEDVTDGEMLGADGGAVAVVEDPLAGLELELDEDEPAEKPAE